MILKNTKKTKMGGNALKSLNSVRLSKEEYKKIEADVLSKIEGLFDRTIVPTYFKDKDNFGDLDVLVVRKEGEGIQSVFDKIKDIFNPRETFQTSFDYQLENGDSFQVDIIDTPRESFDASFFFHCYSDLCLLLGSIYSKLNYSLGQNLMTVNKKEGGKIVKEVFTKDPVAMLGILGYSEDDYKRIFGNGGEGSFTRNQFCDWIIEVMKKNNIVYKSGKFFKPNFKLFYGNKKGEPLIRFIRNIQIRPTIRYFLTREGINVDKILEDYIRELKANPEFFYLKDHHVAEVEKEDGTIFYAIRKNKPEFVKKMEGEEEEDVIPTPPSPEGGGEGELKPFA